jgi:hypothetical protein
MNMLKISESNSVIDELHPMLADQLHLACQRPDWPTTASQVISMFENPTVGGRVSGVWPAERTLCSWKISHSRKRAQRKIISVNTEISRETQKRPRA